MSTRIRHAAKGLTTRRVRAATRARGLWVEVDPGFHVGNDRSQYLGSINGDAVVGFSAFGPRSEYVGRFDDLEAAKAAVIAAASGAATAVEALRG